MTFHATQALNTLCHRIKWGQWDHRIAVIHWRDNTPHLARCHCGHLLWQALHPIGTM